MEWEEVGEGGWVLPYIQVDGRVRDVLVLPWEGLVRLEVLQPIDWVSVDMTMPSLEIGRRAPLGTGSLARSTHLRARMNPPHAFCSPQGPM